MAVLMAIPFFFRNMPDEAGAKANLDIIGIGLLTISIVMFAVYISLYHVFYLLAGIFCLIEPQFIPDMQNIRLLTVL